jgi:hypothetical protein
MLNNIVQHKTIGNNAYDVNLANPVPMIERHIQADHYTVSTLLESGFLHVLGDPVHVLDWCMAQAR